tara:strand:+ start:2403 stop:2954 length:552 start_codon:yes stop_codon:yes gene_type:complete
LDFRPKLSEIKHGMTLNRIIMGVFGSVGIYLSACSDAPHIEVYTIPAESAPPESWDLATPLGPEKARYTISEGLIGSVNISMTVLQGDGGGMIENVNRWRGQLGLEPVEGKDLEKMLKPVEALGSEARLVNLTGTSKRSQLEERLVGVIAPQGELTWFYKLMGTPDLVEKSQEGFLEYLPNWR